MLILQSHKDGAIKKMEQILARLEAMSPDDDPELWSLLSTAGALLHTFGHHAAVYDPDVGAEVRDPTPEERTALRAH